jgi:hypothetical protein
MRAWVALAVRYVIDGGHGRSFNKS